jgi:hypothetical protein
MRARQTAIAFGTKESCHLPWIWVIDCMREIAETDDEGGDRGWVRYFAVAMRRPCGAISMTAFWFINYR